MKRPGKIQMFANSARSFVKDNSGASAIEFAFVLPLLLVMYLGTMELGQGIEANKKVSRSAAMIGDLVTQSQTLTRQEIDGILVVGDSIMQPYYRSRPTITITAIRIDASSVARVAWSRKIVAGNTSGGTAVGTTVTVPSQLRTANTFVVKVETTLQYKPVLTWNADTKSFGGAGYSAGFTDIPMAESYYLRPRQSAEVICTGC